MNGPNGALGGRATPARVGPRPSPTPRARIALTARLALGAGEDAEVAVQLERLSAHLLVPGLVEMQLDMSALTRCGPSVLGAVRELGEQLAQRGVTLSVRGPVTGVVLEALDVAPLPDVFAFYALLRATDGRSGV